MATTSSGKAALLLGGVGLGVATAAYAVPVALAGLGVAGIVAGTAIVRRRYPDWAWQWDYAPIYWEYVVPLHHAIWQDAGWDQFTDPRDYIDIPIDGLNDPGGIMISSAHSLLPAPKKQWISEAARIKLRLNGVPARYQWVEGGPHNFLHVTAKAVTEKAESRWAYIEKADGDRMFVRLENLRPALKAGAKLLWHPHDDELAPVEEAGDGDDEPLELPPGDPVAPATAALPSPMGVPDPGAVGPGRPGSGSVVVAATPSRRALPRPRVEDEHPGLISLRDASCDQSDDGGIVELTLHQLHNDRKRYQPDPDDPGAPVFPDAVVRTGTYLYSRPALVQWEKDRPVDAGRQEASG